MTLCVFYWLLNKYNYNVGRQDIFFNSLLAIACIWLNIITSISSGFWW